MTIKNGGDVINGSIGDAGWLGIRLLQAPAGAPVGRADTERTSSEKTAIIRKINPLVMMEDWLEWTLARTIYTQKMKKVISNFGSFFSCSAI